MPEHRPEASITEKSAQPHIDGPLASLEKHVADLERRLKAVETHMRGPGWEIVWRPSR